MLTVTGTGPILTFIALPVNTDTRGWFFGVVGLIFSVIIALSSTTFASNAMVGFMLWGVRSFRAGDFINVGDPFRRVTVRGLFHTEIQPEDRICDTAKQKKKVEELRDECDGQTVERLHLETSLKRREKDSVEEARLHRQAARVKRRVEAITRYLKLLEDNTNA